MFKIGSRKSALAQIQATHVKQLLEAQGLQTELVLIESTGDKQTHAPLFAIENASPGLFTKQLEAALLEESIDLAVHSLKDLPTEQPPGLMAETILPRHSPQDCLLLHPSAIDNKKQWKVASGSQIGTSSLRREALLLSHRKDIEIVSVRGNVPTRIKKVRDRQVDGVVLAVAGLERLDVDLSGLEKVLLDPSIFVPAPGQGALVVETGASVDPALKKALLNLHDEQTALETGLERKLLRELEGGCTLPFGAFAQAAPSNNHLEIKSFLGDCPDIQGDPRQWKGFHHFDISGPSIETLVAETVAYFRRRCPQLERH